MVNKAKLDSVLNVDELFTSIQGESISTGFPTFFVRLYGCNIKCPYCDTPQEDYKKMTVGEIAEEVVSSGMRYVCITGGEPLLQANAITLAEYLSWQRAGGYLGQSIKVSIETNGTMRLPKNDASRGFRYVMDIKLPSSGITISPEDMKYNILQLTRSDEIKFVAFTSEDLKVFEEFYFSIYDFWKNSCTVRGTNYGFPNIILSPGMKEGREEENRVWLSYLSEYVVMKNLYKVRLGIQIHKIIGVK